MRDPITMIVRINANLQEQIPSQDALVEISKFEKEIGKFKLSGVILDAFQQENPKSPQFRNMLHECFSAWPSMSTIEDSWRSVYLTNEERLSQEFNVLTPSDLNDLKKMLCALLIEFEEKNTHLIKYKNYNDNYKSFLIHTELLIKSAKSISSLIAGLRVVADITQTSPILMEYSAECMTTLTKSLAQNIMQLTSNRQSSESIEMSALQFEMLRESLINNLQQYIGSRAQLLEGTRSGDSIHKIYRPIDRGIFYNHLLQNRRIGIANELLVQLNFMNDGVKRIETPLHLIDLLKKTMNKNEQAHCIYGNLQDKQGELAKLLNNAHAELEGYLPKSQENESHGFCWNVMTRFF